MKTFKLIGIALAAVYLCMNFSSCSKDDGPTEDPEEGGVVVSGKRLIKITSSWDDETDTCTFNYDNNGRLIKAEYKEDNYTETYQFAWGDNIIQEVTNEENITYTLKNGLIQDFGGMYSVIYNNTNRFISIKNISTNYGLSATAIWDNDKLMSLTCDGESIFTYEGKTCKGFIPYLTTFGMDLWYGDLLFMAHPEIIGMQTTQLPATQIGDIDACSYSYEFDKDGYVSKVIEKYYLYGKLSRETIFSITWQ